MIVQTRSFGRAGCSHYAAEQCGYRAATTTWRVRKQILPTAQAHRTHESADNFCPQIGTFQQSESAIFAEAGIGSSEQFGRLVLNLRQRRGVSLFGVALEHIVHPQCGIIVRPTPLMTMRAASASRSCFPGSFA